ncbi:MAG: transporter substrate-binding domain-containing protein, partial [Clostridia bacterium]|nr:transporter substrate-binding domain-containing protein [Clostridia bacterium]
MVVDQSFGSMIKARHMSEKKKNWKMILAGVISVFLLCSNFLPVSVRAAETEQKNKYVTTLRVAFCPLEGFFEYDASGREVGYGVEFLDAVARYAGIRFTYVKADSWEETKQMLLDGEADIRMPGNLPTEPSDIFQYSNYSVIDTYYAMMTLNTRDDLYFEDYDTFGSLRIGISENQYDYIGETAGFQSLGIDKEQLIFYDGYNACRQALEDGQVDAVISNMNRTNEGCIRINDD